MNFNEEIRIFFNELDRKYYLFKSAENLFNNSSNISTYIFPINHLAIITIPLSYFSVCNRDFNSISLSHALFEYSVQIHKDKHCRVVYLYEDLWMSKMEMIKDRIKMHLGFGKSVFARNCECKRINSTLAKSFLKETHVYGFARARYHFGLFIKKDRSVLTKDRLVLGSKNENSKLGLLVAVASFSAPRKMTIDRGGIKSYEWVRYASSQGIRVVGGMGKVMMSFVRLLRPNNIKILKSLESFEIMSYADCEWSNGNVYRKLGFQEISIKDPVSFNVDSEFNRCPINKNDNALLNKSYDSNIIISNLGSIKFIKSF
ncbi:MAG: hypothetical protein WC140_00425 [Bacteroidales bacterium]